MILGSILNRPDVGEIEHTFWLPNQGTSVAKDVDVAFMAAMWVSVFFFVVIVGAMVYFAWKYRRRTEGESTSDIHDNVKLEVAWSVIPLVIVVVLFFVGLKGYVNANVPPGDTYDIHVQAQKWSWTFIYPDGTISPNKLVLPKGREIRVILSSSDVLHSFYIPAFRVKQDAVPSMYTTLWFEPVKVERTVLMCTEYCGKDHSSMLADVVIMEQADFDKWLDAQNKFEPTAEKGKELYASFNCQTCHGAQGEGGQGPKLQGVFGRKEQTNKGEVTVDEQYLRESIMTPSAKVVKGYQDGLMPPFQGQMKEPQLMAIIAYLKSLK